MFKYLQDLFSWTMGHNTVPAYVPLPHSTLISATTDDDLYDIIKFDIVNYVRSSLSVDGSTGRVIKGYSGYSLSQFPYNINSIDFSVKLGFDEVQLKHVTSDVRSDMMNILTTFRCRYGHLTIGEVVTMICNGQDIIDIVDRHVDTMRRSVVYSGIMLCIEKKNLPENVLSEIITCNVSARSNDTIYDAVLKYTDLGRLVSECKYDEARTMLADYQTWFWWQMSPVLNDVLVNVKHYHCIAETIIRDVSTSQSNLDRYIHMTGSADNLTSWLRRYLRSKRSDISVITTGNSEMKSIESMLQRRAGFLIQYRLHTSLQPTLDPLLKHNYSDVEVEHIMSLVGYYVTSGMRIYPNIQDEIAEGEYWNDESHPHDADHMIMGVIELATSHTVNTVVKSVLQDHPCESKWFNNSLHWDEGVYLGEIREIVRGRIVAIHQLGSIDIQTYVDATMSNVKDAVTEIILRSRRDMKIRVGKSIIGKRSTTNMGCKNSTDTHHDDLDALMMIGEKIINTVKIPDCDDLRDLVEYDVLRRYVNVSS